MRRRRQEAGGRSVTRTGSAQGGPGGARRPAVPRRARARGRVLTLVCARQFMKSPEYTKPVMDFIDEHCPVFDGEEVRVKGARVGGGAALLAATGNLACQVVTLLSTRRRRRTSCRNCTHSLWRRSSGCSRASCLKSACRKKSESRALHHPPCIPLRRRAGQATGERGARSSGDLDCLHPRRQQVFGGLPARDFQWRQERLRIPAGGCVCARCYAWSVAHQKRGEMCGRWQIMAADDFQAFNKMMVQRQRQLSYESLKQIQRMQLAAGAQELRVAG